MFGLNIYPYGNATIPLYCIIITCAILKYRLLDVRIVVTRIGIFTCVYTLILGLPFIVGLKILGLGQWVIPTSVMAVFATVGPYLYSYLQKKTEAVLLKEQIRYQNSIMEASSGINRIRDFKKLINLVMDILTHGEYFKHGMIYVENKSEGKYYLEVSRNQEILNEETKILEYSSPLIQYLHETKSFIIYSEIVRRYKDERNPRFAEIESRLKHLQADLVIPIFIEQSLLAAIFLGSRRIGRHYGSPELTAFSILANQTALAIETCLYYKKVEEAQEGLYQAQKLASLGQLAGGVAHEINNPLGFVSSNFQILEDYIRNCFGLLRIMGSLKQAVKDQNLKTANFIVTEMNALEEKMNMDFMRADISKLLEGSQRGLERIRKIVMDLRTFARADSKDMEFVNIHDVIHSVLNIVWNEIKYKADLKQEYTEIPLIKGNPQRLGQVFINLLINAAQAIEDKGMIAIKTFQKNAHVCVEISDTGQGIAEENINKIFDPFFTTKPIGQGTGLGLSISYDIVKKYGGEIDVQSQVGQGTTFTVMFPIPRDAQHVSKNSING
jgi:signal transduction histidine kinase